MIAWPSNPRKPGCIWWQRLKSGGDDRAISRAAGELGVQAPALSTYFQGQPYATGLVLGYAGVDREPSNGQRRHCLKRWSERDRPSVGWFDQNIPRCGCYMVT